MSRTGVLILREFPDTVKRFDEALVMFEAGWTHPAKAAVTEALASFGYRPPPWYEVLKHDGEPQVNDPANLAAVAMAAGYRDGSTDDAARRSGLKSTSLVVGRCVLAEAQELPHGVESVDLQIEVVTT